MDTLECACARALQAASAAALLLAALTHEACGVAACCAQARRCRRAGGTRPRRTSWRCCASCPHSSLGAAVRVCLAYSQLAGIRGLTPLICMRQPARKPSAPLWLVRALAHPLQAAAVSAADVTRVSRQVCVGGHGAGLPRHGAAPGHAGAPRRPGARRHARLAQCTTVLSRCAAPAGGPAGGDDGDCERAGVPAQSRPGAPRREARCVRMRQRHSKGFA